MRAPLGREERLAIEAKRDGPVVSPKLPRFSLQPVLNLLAEYEHPQDVLCARLDAPSSQVSRWKADGLHFWSADRVAVALGVHPAFIWPDWWTAQPKPRSRK